MTVKISGNSSASTPSFAGDDGDSGLHATADQVQLVTNGTVAVTVDSSQNVGIGKTPAVTLDVDGTIAADGGYYVYNATNDGLGIWYNPGATGVNQLTARVNGSDRLTIDSSGRLLVGTTTAPFSNTDALIQSASNFGANIVLGRKNKPTVAGQVTGATLFYSYDGSTYHQSSAIAGISDAAHGTGSVPGRLSFATTSNGASSPTERLRITSVGHTEQFYYFLHYNYSYSSTNYKYTGLDQNGAYVIYNQANVGVYLAANANSWSASSDERLKTDLVPIEDGLAKVNSLRAVTGRYLSDEVGVSRSFLIAQDVQQVLPEAVDAQDPENLGLSYTDVIPLLVAALKDAKDSIETLETVNAEQATTIASFEARISALEGGN